MILKADAKNVSKKYDVCHNFAEKTAKTLYSIGNGDIRCLFMD